MITFTGICLRSALPSACPAAASPFWFMLFFLLFFFLSLMGDDWPGSFPEKGLAVPSRASDIFGANIINKSHIDIIVGSCSKWATPQSVSEVALAMTQKGFSGTYRHFVPWWTVRRGSAEDLSRLLEGTNHQTGHRPQTEWQDTAEELTA